MTVWNNLNYQQWISNGCDINSAAEVDILEMELANTNNCLHAGLLKHFVNLRHLSISYCCLTTIPEDVWELTQLTRLYVNNNAICEISPKIKNLTKLEVFHCDCNNITAFPVEICQLTKLVHFDFYDNKLDVLDQTVVDFVSQIQHVNQYYNNTSSSTFFINSTKYYKITYL